MNNTQWNSLFYEHGIPSGNGRWSFTENVTLQMDLVQNPDFDSIVETLLNEDLENNKVPYLLITTAFDLWNAVSENHKASLLVRCALESFGDVVTFKIIKALYLERVYYKMNRFKEEDISGFLLICKNEYSKRNTDFRTEYLGVSMIDRIYFRHHDALGYWKDIYMESSPI